MKKITIAIPAYRAQRTIPTLLASILMQTSVSNCKIIIANDDPKENGSYDFVKALYPTLEINLLDCEVNTGPGLARQRALDACTTQWITFADADDVFYNPFSIENLYNNITPNCAEVQGKFYGEVWQGNLSRAEKLQLKQSNREIPPRVYDKVEERHPWVFGRLYNVAYLRDNNISFSALRAMEDAEFNYKIYMLVEGSEFEIIHIDDPIYLWKYNSDHSITRIGIEERGFPLYEWDLCQVGSTVSAVNAIKFCKRHNPFNGGITRFAVERMIEQYFTYVKCLNKQPMFAEQNFWNAKRFYYLCYKDIEKDISKEVLIDMYTEIYMGQGKDMQGFIPEITFFEFMDKIKADEYGGEKEFREIRAKLPDWVEQLDTKSGVLGQEGFIYCDGEEKIE